MRPALALLLLLAAAPAAAQETRGLGLPPPSGSQNPVLPPPSGSQNPVLPPPSGERYVPGVGGRFGGDGSGTRPVGPRSLPGTGGARVIGTVSPVTEPRDGEVDRLADVAPALRRCWNPPSITGEGRGVMATVRFSMRRDGSLFGQPRVAYETRAAEAGLRERFTRSIRDAVRACTPMRLSDGLGAAIAGRPIVIRFHGRAPSTERST